MQKAIALVLVSLMALTSVSYTVNLHYCQGQLRAFNLFGKAKTCHQIAKVCPHHSTQEIDVDENDCCSDESVIIESLDEDYSYSGSTVLPIVVHAFAAAFSSISSAPIHAPKRHTSVVCALRLIPLPSLDIYVRLCRFLI